MDIGSLPVLGNQELPKQLSIAYHFNLLLVDASPLTGLRWTRAYWNRFASCSGNSGAAQTTVSHLSLSLAPGGASPCETGSCSALHVQQLPKQHSGNHNFNSLLVDLSLTKYVHLLLCKVNSCPDNSQLLETPTCSWWIWAQSNTFTSCCANSTAAQTTVNRL